MEASNSAPLPETLHREQRLRAEQVFTLTGRARSWVYKRVAEGEFPAPERDGPRCSRWRAGDVLDWLQAQRERQATTTEQAKPARRAKAEQNTVAEVAP